MGRRGKEVQTCSEGLKRALNREEVRYRRKGTCIDLCLMFVVFERWESEKPEC